MMRNREKTHRLRALTVTSERCERLRDSRLTVVADRRRQS